MQIEDFLFLLVGNLLGLGQAALQVLHLAGVEVPLGFLDPRLGSGDLQIPESPLISLPRPRVVVPDQPANGNQQDQAGDGEPAVQSGDVVQKIFAFFRQR